jgi:hypothetical protein
VTEVQRLRKPAHGRGWLKPFEVGNKLGGRRGTLFTETQRLAREHSVEAVLTLAERLHDRDGKVAVAAAVALLERAWGKVREARPEDEQPPLQIDLSALTDAELGLLLRLAQSDRLRPLPTDGPYDAPQIIEANLTPNPGVQDER